MYASLVIDDLTSLMSPAASYFVNKISHSCIELRIMLFLIFWLKHSRYGSILCAITVMTMGTYVHGHRHEYTHTGLSVYDRFFAWLVKCIHNFVRNKFKKRKSKILQKFYKPMKLSSERRHIHANIYVNIPDISLLFQKISTNADNFSWSFISIYRQLWSQYIHLVMVILLQNYPSLQK